MIAEESVRRVYQALEAGTLDEAALTARALAEHLGQTTSLLYHHFGSLDGFLYAVSIAGFVQVGERLEALTRDTRGLQTAAEEYVVFALDHPALYRLMYERRFDFAALRAQGRLQIEGSLRAWRANVALFHKLGSRDPDEDARLFHAGLHGIVSLAASGRMNIGDLAHSDREVALRSARRLARTLKPSPRK